ncbi:MAG: hypothetical protein M3R52_12365 [Acidobacteriota bacterium]|nr:hypothetical protein [Acidobacteriota bacterium]
MRHLRLLIIALATICVLALGAYALVNTPPRPPVVGDDEIIIKGGSLEVQCGKNHKNDNAGCLALDDGNTGKYKHKQGDKHITRIVVRRTNGDKLFDSDAPYQNLGDKPEISITYKATTLKAP